MRYMQNFVKKIPRKMVKSLFHLLMKVNHVIVSNIHVANKSTLSQK